MEIRLGQEDYERQDWPEIRIEFFQTMADYWKRKEAGSKNNGHQQTVNVMDNAAERLFIAMRHSKLAEFLEHLADDGIDDKKDVLAAKALLNGLTQEEWHLFNDAYREWEAKRA